MLQPRTKKICNIYESLIMTIFSVCFYTHFSIMLADALEEELCETASQFSTPSNFSYLIASDVNLRQAVRYQFR
jgi:hypothetical protein